MKKISLFILLFAAGLSSCTEDNAPLIPKADFSIVEEGDKVFILNRSVGFSNFRISFAGDSPKYGEVSDTLYTFNFARNGSQSISVCFYNGFNEEETRRCKSANFQVSNLKPVYSFIPKYLGKGKYQLINQSKYIGTAAYYLNTRCSFFIPDSDTLLLNFERNGNYSLRTGDNKLFDIVVDDLPKAEPLQQFTGNFLGEENPAPRNAYNDFYCSYGLAAITYTPVQEYKTDKGGLLIMNKTAFRPDQFGNRPSGLDKYNYYKSILKLGSISTQDWDIRFYKGSSVLNGAQYDKIANASVEIINVEEVDQIMVTPDMYNKSFWVTFKINVDAPDVGLYKGILKVKYVMF